MTTSIFGTDGVRGTPGQSPLDPVTVERLGAATVRALGVEHPHLLSVRDTRESGPAIERQLAAGVGAEGGTLVSAGVMPTPAAALLASREEFAGAFVISASHNPYPDNGIKLLTDRGEKAPELLEDRVSELIEGVEWRFSASSSSALETRDLTAAYRAFAMSVLGSTDGWSPGRIAVDCANGAMCEVAPAVFSELGFDVVPLGTHPDGRNINAGCGSTHPEALAETVRRERCRLGIAFDGDGDRAILVDGEGQVVDGDAMLYVCARHLDSQGRLPGHGVVATVMSNLGLQVGLREAGIVMHRCPVGDRSVGDAMRRHGVVLGGEQSGHLIFSERLPTGDGLATALTVLRVVRETERELEDLRRALEVYPQVLLNVPVRDKPALATEPAITDAVDAATRELGDRGRVVVRYSGTELLLRVMVEGPDETDVRRLADTIADVARTRLG